LTTVLQIGQGNVLRLDNSLSTQELQLKKIKDIFPKEVEYKK
jgi:hypothetical protein